ncbi:extracellular matrix protein 1 [Pluvialis apricaria]
MPSAGAGGRLLFAGAPRRHRVCGPDLGLTERLRLFQRLRAAQERRDGAGDGAGGGRVPPGTPIRIALPGGGRLPGRALQTTPFQVATQLGGGLAEAALVARVNGTLQDLDRPLESDTDLELLDFSTPEGQATFWRSGACVLGAVAEQFYGATLCSAQATEDGFFCDVHMGDRTVQRGELPALEEACAAFARAGHRFERLEATRQQLAELFKVRPAACPLPGMSPPQCVPSPSQHGAAEPSVGTLGPSWSGLWTRVMPTGTSVTFPQCPLHLVLQRELEPQLPPGVLAAVAVGPTRPSPPWASALDGFPPAWPMAAAVTRHCRQPPEPSPTPPLPRTAFAHLRRQAAALDALRPRLNACCRHHAPLPCARRAWTDVLDGFCTDEFGVKTRQFHCCRRHGAARRRCFAEGPDAVAAAATAIAVVTDWEPSGDLSFPPGEPTAANMGNICGLWGLRPGTANHPGRAGPRVRFRVRLERDYGRCCRNGSLACAHKAWQKGLERFCREESAVKTGQHRCCRGGGGGRARGRCFAAAAPHPSYDREVHNVSLSRPGPALLRSLCAPTRLLTRRPPVPELLGAVTAACCPLPPEERSACAQEQLSQGIATLCATPQDAWRDPQGCCSWGDPERRRCFDTEYLARVTLGAAVAPPPFGQDE